LVNESLSQLWSLFESDICDLSTRRFLERPDLVSVISPLTNVHAASEAARLKTFLVADQSVTTRELIARRPRLALSNCQLISYTGSELWTEEAALALAQLGLPIITYAPKLGALADRMRQNGLLVTDDPEVVAQFAPTLLHLNHYAAAAPMLSSVRNKPAIVNMVHGLLPRPGLPGLEGVNQYCAVGLHAVAKTHLLTGRPWDSIRMLPSFFDPAKFPSYSDRERGRNALLFSSKTSPAHRERLTALLSACGYSLDHVGYGGVPSAAPGELLPNYDIVFAVARSAVEALACGCAVVLWDDGLVGPMVTGADFWLSVAANFSMVGDVLPRCAIDSPASEPWLYEQIGALDQAREVCDLAQTYLSIDRVMPILFECYLDAMKQES
jgi:hypothetical protein